MHLSTLLLTPHTPLCAHNHTTLAVLSHATPLLQDPSTNPTALGPACAASLLSCTGMCFFDGIKRQNKQLILQPLSSGLMKL